MSEPPIPPLLGRLSDDLLFALDAAGVVCAANPRVGSLLGVEPVGRHWAELLAARSREKGLAFLAALSELPAETASHGWELQLHAAGAPLLVMARGGRTADNGLLIAARSETGRLSALYYEALAINNDLTTLARRLTNESRALAARLAALEQERSAHTMQHETELTVARALDAHREELSDQVAEALAGSLPMVGLSPAAPDRAARHHERMRSTAQRFHQLVQLGVTADWGLVAHEYAWTARVLTQLGITWEHQQSLLDTYFQAARALPWADEERNTLDGIIAHVRVLGAEAYAAGAAAL